MKIIADTNVLGRAVVRDDARQGKIAPALLSSATVIAVASPTLCELVWVLRKLYGFERDEIITALRALLDAANVVVDGPAAEAGPRDA